MKDLLMVSPTDFEIKAALDIDYKKAVIGIGPICSAIKITQLLEQKLPQGVILFGICGAYPDSGLKVGDVVIAGRETFVDIARCFYEDEEPIDILTNEDLVFNLLDNIHLLLKDIPSYISIVNFATVCCSTMYKERAYRLADKWNVSIENMEGASVAKVCKLYNVPFLEVRSVSNIVCDPIELWEIDKAIESLKLFLNKIVRLIN